MHQSLGLTGPQRLVLRIVGRFPGVTPSATFRECWRSARNRPGCVALSGYNRRARSFTCRHFD
jgi:hypothetical protein